MDGLPVGRIFFILLSAQAYAVRLTVFLNDSTFISARSDDDDYDIDFYTNAHEATDPAAPSPREQLEVIIRHIPQRPHAYIVSSS